MKYAYFAKAAAAAAIALTLAAQANAAIVISEVAPYASGSTSYAADWFELTNTGTSAVDITGWKVDDNSNTFGSALALRGVTSIGAGKSVIFLEGTANGSTDASLDAAFVSAWFGGNAPAGLQIGNYGGSGIGLSATADAVNIYNASGTLITRVDFGASTTGQSFDNAQGLTGNVTLTQLSAVGVNGAFTSFNGAEIGSPGSIAAVPEPESFAIASVGLVLLAAARRRVLR